MKNKGIIILITSTLVIAVFFCSLISVYPINSGQKNTFHIVFLYCDMSASEPWRYSTEATVGLEFAIDRELKNLNLNYEAVRLVKSETQESLNKTLLDSFDLIVVGGISYWWSYVSNEDRLALLQTETPILASICYGVEPDASLSRMLTGVWASTNSVRVGINILSGTNTLVKFTEYAPEPLKNSEHPVGWATLINANISDSGKVYAYAIRDGQQYPLLVFNGTKNMLINVFTYKSEKDYNQWTLKWPLLMLIALNEIFHFLPDEVLGLRIFPKPELMVLRLFDRFYLILNQLFIIPFYIFTLFAMFLVKYVVIKRDHKSFKLRSEVSITELKRVMLRTQETTLISLIALFLAQTYSPDIPLVIPTMLQQCFAAAIAFVIILYILDLRHKIS